MNRPICGLSFAAEHLVRLCEQRVRQDKNGFSAMVFCVCSESLRKKISHMRMIYRMPECLACSLARRLSNTIQILQP